MNKSQQIPARFQAALERLDGDAELLCELASITGEDLPQVTKGIEVAIEEGNCSDAASGLHKLKGMLSTFDADGVTLEIQEVLDAARRGDVQELQRGYTEHRREIVRLIDEISALAATRGD